MDHLEKERLIETLQKENEKIKRLLHDLTPGGSEFYNDSEYCAKYIRESRLSELTSLKQIIVTQKLEIRDLKEEIQSKIEDDAGASL